MHFIWLFSVKMLLRIAALFVLINQERQHNSLNILWTVACTIFFSKTYSLWYCFIGQTALERWETIKKKKKFKKKYLKIHFCVHFWFYTFYCKIETVGIFFKKNAPNMTKCPLNYLVKIKNALKTSDLTLIRVGLI